MKLAVALFSAMALIRTCGTPDPKPVPDPAGTGGSVVVDDAGDECAAKVFDPCGLAGERVCRLGCRSNSGAPLWRTPGGRSFAEVCREALEDGRSWRPDCLARIIDCSQLESAYRTSEGTACAL